MPADAGKVLKDIAELVGIPSVSSTEPALDSSNKEVIEHLGSMLESAGFKAEYLPVAGTTDKFNLLASKGAGSGGLALSGHTDTVPFNAELWDTDPFCLTERDGRLFGLGATDMKAFFALALAAAARYSKNDLQKKLIVVATADEESGMAGARSLVADAVQLADVALIGEPTDLKPVRVHKGILMERITLRGRSGHSSDPALGVNALDGMRAVLNELAQYRDELKSKFTDKLFHVPYPTINFGRIAGGDNPNRICGECSLDVDCRFLPGMKIAEMRTRIRERVRCCLDGSGLEVGFHEIFHGVEAMDTPADSTFVAAVERLTGCEAGGVAFATEAPYFAELGTEVVVAGPGSIDQAHQPNEYIRLDFIEPTLSLLDSMIGNYCVNPDDGAC